MVTPMNDNWQVITKSEKIMPPKTLMNLKSTIIISSFQCRSGFNCTLFNSQVISEAIIVLGKTFPLAPQQHQLKQEAEWETTRSKWIGNFVVFSREIFTKLLNSKCFYLVTLFDRQLFTVFDHQRLPNHRIEWPKKEPERCIYSQCPLLHNTG